MDHSSTDNKAIRDIMVKVGYLVVAVFEAVIGIVDGQISKSTG